MAKQDDYIKTALRLPRALHEALTNAAADRGHSLNTEMVTRLDGSFSSALMSSETADVMRSLVAASENQAKLIRVQRALLMKTGNMMALALNLGSPPPGETGRRLHSISKRFAEAIAKDDLADAMEPMMELIEIGKQSGVLDDSGQVKPEHEHLRDSPRPRRKLDV